METISQRAQEVLRCHAARVGVLARGQPLEIIMTDTHTVAGQPWRIKRWVGIAREEVA